MMINLCKQCINESYKNDYRYSFISDSLMQVLKIQYNTNLYKIRWHIQISQSIYWLTKAKLKYGNIFDMRKKNYVYYNF